MSMELANNRSELREHLSLMMAKEKQSGEFLLASVVQDSLLYNLNHHAESETLLQIAHLAAEVAVESAAIEMAMNSFTVSESIRGVMHTMVNLGGDPVLVAVAITTGALAGIQATAAKEEHPDYSYAIVSGLSMAADDLGLDTYNIETVAEHIVEHADGVPYSRLRGEN